MPRRSSTVFVQYEQEVRVVHEFAHEFMSALHPRYISVLYAHVQSISLEYSRVSRTRIARACSFPYIIPRLLIQRTTIFIPTSNTPNPPNLYIRICFVIIRDDNSLLIPAYVLLYHVIFLRIFTSLIPLNFRLYPDYSSISHSRFLSKNEDGVGMEVVTTYLPTRTSNGTVLVRLPVATTRTRSLVRAVSLQYVSRHLHPIDFYSYRTSTSTADSFAGSGITLRGAMDMSWYEYGSRDFAGRFGLDFSRAVVGVPFILYLVRFCSSKSCKYGYVLSAETDAVVLGQQEQTPGQVGRPRLTYGATSTGTVLSKRPSSVSI